MNQLLQNAKVAIQEPHILATYLQWCTMKTFTTPKITVQGHTIQNFINFSEFIGVQSHNVNQSEFKFINNLLTPQSVAIDIGGNIGVFTLLLASLCKQVYTFEPVPNTFQRLQQNVLNNQLKNVSLHQVALSDTNGYIPFSITPNSPATNRIAVAKDNNVIEVPVTTLEEFVKEHKLKNIDFLKIDVEGFEANVLRGARGLLKNHNVKCLFIEICPANFQRVGSSIEDIVSLLEGEGYQGHLIEANGELSEKIHLSAFQKVDLRNAVFLLP